MTKCMMHIRKLPACWRTNGRFRRRKVIQPAVMRNEWEPYYWCYSDSGTSSVIVLPSISYCSGVYDVAMITPLQTRQLTCGFVACTIYTKIIDTKIGLKNVELPPGLFEWFGFYSWCIFEVADEVFFF